MNKIKKGDEIIVIAGKDKGKKGTVLTVYDGGARLLVEGINMVKKAVKDNPNEQKKGGILSKTMPIHRSNVMIYDASTQKGSRVGIKIASDGVKTRYLKSSGQLLDVKK